MSIQVTQTHVPQELQTQTLEGSGAKLQPLQQTTVPPVETGTIVNPKQPISLEAVSPKETHEAPCPSNGTRAIIQNTEIKGEKHLHLSEDFTDPIQKMFNEPVKSQGREVSEKILNALMEKGFIDKDCNIITKGNSDARKAHIEGKVFIDEKGEIDYKISGRCGENAVAFMQKFKDTVKEITETNKDLKDFQLNINPQLVAKPSVSDLEALRHGGQMQYRTLPDGDVVKLLIDPGENGENDSLEISVFNGDLGEPKVKPQKIPLSVVFEGAEYGDNKERALKDGRPLLSNWRQRELFEKSQIKQEYSMYLPGVSRFDKKVKDNTDDVDRIQAQNTIWNAVNEYLKLTGKTTEQVFDIGNTKISSTQVNEGDNSTTQQTRDKNGIRAEARSPKVPKGLNIPLGPSVKIDTEESTKPENVNRTPVFDFSDLETHEEPVDFDALAREAVIKEDSKDIQEGQMGRKRPIAQAREAKHSSGMEKFMKKFQELSKTASPINLDEQTTLDMLNDLDGLLVEELGKEEQDTGKIDQLLKDFNGISDIVDEATNPKLQVLKNELKGVRAQLKSKPVHERKNLLKAARLLSDSMSNLRKVLATDDANSVLDLGKASGIPPMQDVESLRTGNDVNQKNINDLNNAELINILQNAGDSGVLRQVFSTKVLGSLHSVHIRYDQGENVRNASDDAMLGEIKNFLGLLVDKGILGLSGDSLEIKDQEGMHNMQLYRDGFNGERIRTTTGNQYGDIYDAMDRLSNSSINYNNSLPRG